MVSYDELRRGTQNFDQENLIGTGGFGSVFKGSIKDGIRVAVKVLDLGRTGAWKSFNAECEALRNVRHRNLVKLITLCSSLDLKKENFRALVYELMGNGSLEDWIRGRRRHEDGGGLNVVERLNVAIDVGCAMNYLHHDCHVTVVHCDLKPSNVLLDEDMTAKVGDFGLARMVAERDGNHQSNTTDGLKGSIGYIPPEYGFGVKPTTKGDVYSYGIMLLELFTGKTPTDEIFTGGLSLAVWVQSAFPTNVIHVLDSELLLQTINPQVQQDQCLASIIEVGLLCVADLPDERISMTDVVHKLNTIRDTLLSKQPSKVC